MYHYSQKTHIWIYLVFLTKIWIDVGMWATSWLGLWLCFNMATFETIFAADVFSRWSPGIRDLNFWLDHAYRSAAGSRRLLAAKNYCSNGSTSLFHEESVASPLKTVLHWCRPDANCGQHLSRKDKS